MTDSNPLVTCNELGQSLWLDFIQRSLIENGELEQLIKDDKIAGLTSNPAIFKQAIAGTTEYDDAIKTAVAANPNDADMAIYTQLAIADICGAADLFLPVYDATGGQDGMVSIEVSPALAHDADGTVTEALELHQAVNRPNVMIKVPGTEAGVVAFERLTAAGVNVNVTLLFSVARYEAIVDAYLKGLEQRLDAGQSIAGQTSVASFFISRVDSAVDAALGSNTELSGQIAIANAKVAYAHYGDVFQSPRFARLREAGALPQRLLWASTGTKNPDYSDVLYIDSLIGPETVNTVPPATLDAFRDHGTAAVTLTEGTAKARAQLEQLEAQGIDLTAITDKIEKDGVDAFCDAFDTLLDSLHEKRQALA